MPNIIYLGKTIVMIECETLEKFRSVENQQSGVQEINTPECGFSTVHNNKNNKYINNNYKGYQGKKVVIKAERINLDIWTSYMPIIIYLMIVLKIIKIQTELPI